MDLQVASHHPCRWLVLIDGEDQRAPDAFSNFKTGFCPRTAINKIPQSVLHGREDGAPPPVDLAKERAHAEYVRQLIHDSTVNAVHDVADGGLLVALTEMALASGRGCVLTDIDDAATAFGEDQARYLIATSFDKAEALMAAASAAGVPIAMVGKFGGDKMRMGGSEASLASLASIFRSAFEKAVA